jgi:hypothetical protein
LQHVANVEKKTSNEMISGKVSRGRHGVGWHYRSLANKDFQITIPDGVNVSFVNAFGRLNELWY